MTDKEIGKAVREATDRGNTVEAKPSKNGEIVIVEKQGKIIMRGFPERKGQ